MRFTHLVRTFFYQFFESCGSFSETRYFIYIVETKHKKAKRQEVHAVTCKTEERLQKISYRVRKQRVRREKLITRTLGSACLMLSLEIGVVAHSVYSPRTSQYLTGSFGTMLLRDDAGAYVVVSVVAFAVGVALTVICIKLKKKKFPKKENDLTVKEEHK